MVLDVADAVWSFKEEDWEQRSKGAKEKGLNVPFFTFACVPLPLAAIDIEPFAPFSHWQSVKQPPCCQCHSLFLALS